MTQCSNAIFFFIFSAVFLSGAAMPAQRLKMRIVAKEPSRVHEIKALPNSSHSDSLNLVADPASLIPKSTESLQNVSSPIWSCDTHIKKHPDEISCPANCPYLRAEPTRLCQFKCVPATDCNADNPLASYANPSSMRCEACHVAGCHRCGENRNFCAVCQDGFELTEGTCLSMTRHYWHAFFVVLGIIAVFLIYYLVALFYLRKRKNEAVLKAGLEFREHSIVRIRNSDGELDKISLFKNLMSAKSDFCGAALMLHFRWMGAVMAWAIFGMVLFGIAGLLFWETLGVMHNPNSRKSYNACEENVQSQKEAFNNMEAVYFVCTMIMYLVTFLGSLWLAAYQHEAYKRQDIDNITMKDFALMATGFPVCRGQEKVEEDRLRFFKAQPQFRGLDVVGVSVCWDIREKHQEVHEQVRREFDIQSGEVDADYASQTSSAMNYAARTRRACCDHKLRCVDAFLGIGKFPCARSQIEDIPDAVDVKEMLEEIETSPFVFVIFGNTRDQAEACKRCSAEPLVYDRGGDKYDITITETEAEPLSVIWKGYGTDPFKFMMSLVVGCLAVFVCVLILDVFFYAPYVYYILSYSNVAGMSQGGFVSGLLLGLLISVCNQCIYQIIGAVADRCGWTHSDSKDCFYCVKYTLAVFFNTIIDLGTVIILAQGYSVDQAMSMQVANDSTMSPKAIAEAPNMQKGHL